MSNASRPLSNFQTGPRQKREDSDRAETTNMETGVTRMAETKDNVVLSIRGMSKSFGRNRVLDHINLDVKRGTVMGLMGENGAGKSTLMKVLGGIIPPGRGRDPARRRTRAAPQRPRSVGVGHRLYPSGAELVRQPHRNGQYFYEPRNCAPGRKGQKGYARRGQAPFGGNGHSH